MEQHFSPEGNFMRGEFKDFVVNKYNFVCFLANLADLNLDRLPKYKFELLEPT